MLILLGIDLGVLIAIVILWISFRPLDDDDDDG